MKSKSLKTSSKLFLMLFLVTTVASLALFMGGCNKEDDYADEKKSEIKYDYTLDIPQEYNLVGLLHNEGLDSVFSAIKKENKKRSKKGVSTISALDFESLIESSIVKFRKNNAYLKDSYSKNHPKELAAFNAPFKQSHSGVNKTLSSEEKLKNLKPAQLELMKAIRLALKGKIKKVSVAKLESELNKINEQASATLTPEDAAPIYCATSTAFASYQYWMNNYRKWYFAIHYPELLNKFNDEQLNRLFIKKKMSKSKAEIRDTTIVVKNPLSEVVIVSEPTDAPSSWTPFYSGGNDDVSEWWENTGQDMVMADSIGALEGLIRGAWAGGLYGACAGAIIDGCWASASYYIWASQMG